MSPLLRYRNTWLMIAGFLAGLAVSPLTSVLEEFRRNSLKKELAENEALAVEWCREGEKAFEQQNYDLAAVRFDQAIAICRKSKSDLEEKSWRTIGHWHAPPGKQHSMFGEGCVVYLGDIYEFGATLGDILTKRGLLHTQKRDYSSAFADFDEALRLNRENPVAYEGRARVYRAWGDNATAHIDETYAKALRRRLIPESERSKYSPDGTAPRGDDPR